MMELKVHDLVALLDDSPEQRLQRGDVGTVVKNGLPDNRYEIC